MFAQFQSRWSKCWQFNLQTASPECKPIRTKNSWFTLRSQRACDVTAAEALPQPLLHQPRSTGSAVRKSQLCRCPRLFFSAQACYFGASSQERRPRRAERCATRDNRRADTLHLTGSCGVEFVDACDPRRCPSETDCTLPVNEEIC